MGERYGRFTIRRSETLETIHLMQDVLYQQERILGILAHIENKPNTDVPATSAVDPLSRLKDFVDLVRVECENFQRETIACRMRKERLVENIITLENSYDEVTSHCQHLQSEIERAQEEAQNVTKIFVQISTILQSQVMMQQHQNHNGLRSTTALAVQTPVNPLFLPAADPLILHSADVPTAHTGNSDFAVSFLSPQPIRPQSASHRRLISLPNLENLDPGIGSLDLPPLPPRIETHLSIGIQPTRNSATTPSSVSTSSSTRFSSSPRVSSSPRSSVRLNSPTKATNTSTQHFSFSPPHPQSSVSSTPQSPVMRSSSKTYEEHVQSIDLLFLNASNTGVNLQRQTSPGGVLQPLSVSTPRFVWPSSPSPSSYGLGRQLSEPLPQTTGTAHSNLPHKAMIRGQSLGD